MSIFDTYHGDVELGNMISYGLSLVNLVLVRDAGPVSLKPVSVCDQDCGYLVRFM